MCKWKRERESSILPPLKTKDAHGWWCAMRRETIFEKYNWLMWNVGGDDDDEVRPKCGRESKFHSRGRNVCLVQIILSSRDGVQISADSSFPLFTFNIYFCCRTTSLDSTLSNFSPSNTYIFYILNFISIILRKENIKKKEMSQSTCNYKPWWGGWES